MALIKIEPYIIDSTGDFTFNNVNATGNLSSLNANLGNAATANYFIGSGANLTSLPAGNISGQVGNALVAGTVYTAAQPNITSVGTLTGLTSNGIVNFANTSNTTLGAVGNVHITGGSSGQYLQTDGSGTLSWATVTSGSTSNISNGNSNVNIPSANGNVLVSVAGNSNIASFSGTGFSVGLGSLTRTNIHANTALYVTSNISSDAPPIQIQNRFATGYTSMDIVSSSNIFMGAVGAANPNASTVPALANLTYIYGATGASGVGIYATTGNVTISAAGNANIVRVTGTGANITGTLNVSSNANVGNLGFGTGAITGTGNIYAGNANVTGNSSFGPVAIFQNTTNTTTFNQALTVRANNGNNSSVMGIMNEVANGYSSLLFFNNSGVEMGAVAFGNPNSVYFSNSTYLYSAGSGGLILSANIGSAPGNKNLWITNAGLVTIPGSTAATSTTSGAFQVTGGVGIGGNLYAGNANVTGTANITGNIAGGGELNISGNSVVGGNLTVNGTLTYINSTTLSISDPIINLQTGANGAAPVANSGKDVGTALNYYDTSAKIAWMGWDVSNAEIAFGSNVGISSEVVTFTSLANIRSGNAQLGNAATANYFIGNISGSLANGNSNVNIPAANGNINLTAVGNTTMVITGTGVNVAGTFNASGNLSAGNISAGSGSGGSITGGNLVSANYFTGTLTTAAQPNITSVGSLTGLTVSNATGVVNFTTTANVTLGAVANLHISGGTNAYVLSTDGAGNLSWVAQSGGGGGSNIANGNSNVSIASANGNITMSAVGNANIVTVTGTGVNVAGTLNTTGNVDLSGANVSLGAVGNLHITGGTANYVLKTDGAGNLSWAAQTGGNAANVTVDNFTGNGVQTVFTLSTTPIGINQTSINYNGATVLRSDYTLANANITFSSAPADGSLIEVTTINLTSGSGGGTTAAAAVGYSLIFGG